MPHQPHQFLSGNNLPWPVFQNNYRNYIFFDHVMFSEESILSAIIQWAESLGEKFIHYYRFDEDEAIIKEVATSELLPWIEKDQERRVSELIFSGGALFSADGAWAAFQNIPVGLGVIGLNESIDRKIFTRDRFFGIESIQKKGYIYNSLIREYGKEYVEILLNSYTA
ncbi:hypothetical protein CK621_05995 [Vandammella animalimorsus]|uniref:Uncharacterized protein n=2 Tax=Vandammella animalimorsus TaxID=2029117 RepID=A0A2A2AZI0_9BURK|nr:hypothetical protein CK621_05995 [Vandammella animalimorsus]